MSKYEQRTQRILSFQHIELLKALHTKDKRASLAILERTLMNYKNEIKTIGGGVLVNFTYDEHKKRKIINERYKGESEFYKIQERGFRYGNMFYVVYHTTILDVYALDLLENIENKFKGDKLNHIYSLIDLFGIRHKGVLKDAFFDELFEDEYNGYIIDKIQDEIDKVSHTKSDDFVIEQELKPLTWNSNKNTLGTVFGLLIKEGIISGTKESVNKGLRQLFPEFKESTLRDVLSLKVDNDNVLQYCKDTEKQLFEWIEMLKAQKEYPKNKKNKSSVK